MDFPSADYLTGIGEKTFIAELMPRFPIYVNMLDKAAQDVVGKVHQNTLPALKLLQSEGFSFSAVMSGRGANRPIPTSLCWGRMPQKEVRVMFYLNIKNIFAGPQGQSLWWWCCAKPTKAGGCAGGGGRPCAHFPSLRESESRGHTKIFS